MKDIIALMRLAWREKKLLLLSLGCSVFVALFTGVFVNLVQPILDNLFNPARAEPCPKSSGSWIRSSGCSASAAETW